MDFNEFKEKAKYAGCKIGFFSKSSFSEIYKMVQDGEIIEYAGQAYPEKTTGMIGAIVITGDNFYGYIPQTDKTFQTIILQREAIRGIDFPKGLFSKEPVRLRTTQGDYSIGKIFDAKLAVLLNREEEPKVAVTPGKAGELELIPSPGEEVIPVEEYIKDAIASSQGLYPHEILILSYAHKFYIGMHDYQGFWWHHYGIRDVGAVLQTLVERGFLQKGDLISKLEAAAITMLKNSLKAHGLKVNGNKPELIKRLLKEVSQDALDVEFTRQPYQLTSLGKEELEREKYIPHLHSNSVEGLNIWTLNRLIHNEPDKTYLEHIEVYEKKAEIARKERWKENREQMEKLGLKLYVWSTSGDERVRPSHALMEGKICKWADPAVCSTNVKTWKPRPKGATLSHPGQEEGCRCTALSYDKELFGEI